MNKKLKSDFESFNRNINIEINNIISSQINNITKEILNMSKVINGNNQKLTFLSDQANNLIINGDRNEVYAFYKNTNPTITINGDNNFIYIPEIVNKLKLTFNGDKNTLYLPPAYKDTFGLGCFVNNGDGNQVSFYLFKDYKINTIPDTKNTVIKTSVPPHNIKVEKQTEDQVKNRRINKITELVDNWDKNNFSYDELSKISNNSVPNLKYFLNDNNELQSIKKEIQIMYKINTIFDAWIVKFIDNNYISLSKNDCKILGITFEEHLKLFPNGNWFIPTEYIDGKYVIIAPKTTQKTKIITEKELLANTDHVLKSFSGIDSGPW